MHFSWLVESTGLMWTTGSPIKEWAIEWEEWHKNGIHNSYLAEQEAIVKSAN